MPTTAIPNHATSHPETCTQQQPATPTAPLDHSSRNNNPAFTVNNLRNNYALNHGH